MTNRVHLIAVPPDARALAAALGRTHGDYARWVHLKRAETGHLWQNRYYSYYRYAAVLKVLDDRHDQQNSVGVIAARQRRRVSQSRRCMTGRRSVGHTRLGGGCGLRR